MRTRHFDSLASTITKGNLQWNIAFPNFPRFMPLVHCNIHLQLRYTWIKWHFIFILEQITYNFHIKVSYFDPRAFKNHTLNPLKNRNSCKEARDGAQDVRYSTSHLIFALDLTASVFHENAEYASLSAVSACQLPFRCSTCQVTSEEPLFWRRKGDRGE